jgi:SSS family solute:Na+ symporter
VKTIHLFICPMFGLFFLAMFVPFATPFGAIAGAIYSLAAAVGVAYWDVLTGEPRLSFQWMTASALVVSLTTGTLFSLLPTRGRAKAVLAGYGALVALPLAGAIFWLCRR